MIIIDIHTTPFLHMNMEIDIFYFIQLAFRL